MRVAHAAAVSPYSLLAAVCPLRDTFAAYPAPAEPFVHEQGYSARCLCLKEKMMAVGIGALPHCKEPFGCPPPAHTCSGVVRSWHQSEAIPEAVPEAVLEAVLEAGLSCWLSFVICPEIHYIAKWQSTMLPTFTLPR